MKILIASDIHGSAYWAEHLARAVERERPDRIVLLGDLLYHGPRNDLPRDYAPKRVIPVLNRMAERGTLIAVRGNCDAEVDQMVLDFPCMADYAELVDEEGRTLFLTHGHVYGAGVPQQRREPARASGGQRHSVRPHAREGERARARSAHRLGV